MVIFWVREVVPEDALSGQIMRLELFEGGGNIL